MSAKYKSMKKRENNKRIEARIEPCHLSNKLRLHKASQRKNLTSCLKKMRLRIRILSLCHGNRSFPLVETSPIRDMLFPHSTSGTELILNNSAG